MTLSEKASEAYRILNSPIFDELFEGRIRFWTGTWERTSPEDVQSRELAYHRVKAIQEVKSELIKLLNAKRIAES